MLPPNGRRQRFYWLCGRYATRLGILQLVGKPIEPALTYDLGNSPQMRQLPPGDRE